MATANTIFLGAFLLFVIQPLTARQLLPWFGGSPTVWVVSLLFFQTALLAGYAYAHLTSRLLDGRRQAVVHGVLVVLALATLPIGLERVRAPEGDPTGTILLALTTSLGLPLLTLSATNPLLQRWLASRAAAGQNVYRWFALSNFGSLLGLWCYPFVLEPWTTVEQQLIGWSFAYGLFAVSTGVCAYRAYCERAGRLAKVDDDGAPPLTTRALWLALAATGTVVLMATSNQLTRNVAAVPFLWVLPLSLYLVSFIVAFERDRWYVVSRPFWVVLFIGTLLWLLQLLSQQNEPSLISQIVFFSLNLLAGTMICHGELAGLKPRAGRLTEFYLHVALGGALGGGAVSLIAPYVFDGYWEYPLGLLAVYVLGGLSMPLAGRNRLFWAVGGVFVALFLASYVRSEIAGATVMKRSFFGVVRVYDHFPETENWVRYLWNGPVAHGGQRMAPGQRDTPVLYFGPSTGVGLALRLHPAPAKRVGIVGLGTGSLALYGRAGDGYRFYEINPDVVELARDEFYFLREADADVAVEVGDGRLLLEASAPLDLDVLVLDAFTGDAIPVHLLTEEAFAVYERHLAEDGILAIHISNLHIDLRPVLRARAEALETVFVLVQDDGDAERNLYVSDWVLMTTNAEFLSNAEVLAAWTPRVVDDQEDLREFLWTDDFSNLLRILR